MTIDTVLQRSQQFLQAIGFPERRNTRQTAVCIYALLDTGPRLGLVMGKQCLNEGARIHDILEFARQDLGIQVAENTRETYRKHSLKPLLDHFLVTRHSTAVNDPNTYYVLNRSFEEALHKALGEPDEEARNAIASRWAKAFGKEPSAPAPGAISTVTVEVNDQVVTLSPGRHNQLIHDIIQEFAPGFIDQPRVLCVSDAAHKLRYVDERAEELGLVIGEHEKLSDVLLYSTSRNIVYVVEAVTSAGPIDEARIADIEQTLLAGRKPGFGLEYFTAFPDRATFRRFVEDIAWGTQVWLAAEPFGLILFRRYR
jgi:hypothetical protein